MVFGCESTLKKVKIDKQSYHLELSRTTTEREKGLAGRKKLAKNSGMLFLFEDEQILSFWMKNTAIPLQILFIDNCTIVDIQEMSVENDPSRPQKNYTSKYRADKAIELNSHSVSTSTVGQRIDELCSSQY